jgi:uncharacterized protein YjiS (DUF1127 family)
MSASNNTFVVTGSHRPSRPLFSQLADRVQHWRAAWAHRRAHAREMQDLYRCNDRELWDMGLSRSDLMTIENGTFRRN